MLDAVEVHRDRGDVAGEPQRGPLAETSIFSPALEPLKSSRSLPPWPSTVSLPSPGSHWNGRRRRPSRARGRRRCCRRRGRCRRRRRSVSCSGAADQRVVAGAAVDGHVLVCERPAALVDADVVVAGAGLDVDRGEGAAVEAEVGGAVRADVDLERAGRARREAERELVARRVALERQCARLHPCRVGGVRQIGEKPSAAAARPPARRMRAGAVIPIIGVVPFVRRAWS